MKEYVCGFLFSEDRRRVVLIRKNRPEWQAGRYNGIGGKIELNENECEESPLQAMRREFDEEAGLRVEDWKQFARLGDSRGWVIYFFYAFGDVEHVSCMTDEPLFIFPVHSLPPEVLPNLRWLIPMALSMDHERASEFIIREA